MGSWRQLLNLSWLELESLVSIKKNTTHTHTHARAHTHTRTLMRTRTHAHAHTHIHTHTHAHTHTHTHSTKTKTKKQKEEEEEKQRYRSDFNHKEFRQLPPFWHSTVQSTVVFTRPRKSACAPLSLRSIPRMLPLKLFQCWSDWRWRFLVCLRKSFISFWASRFLSIDGVMSLALLCPLLTSQAP